MRLDSILNLIGPNPMVLFWGRVGLRVRFALHHHLCDPILPQFCPLVGVLSAHTACGTMSHRVCKNPARAHMFSLSIILYS